MAYGTLKVDTLTYNDSGSDVSKTIASIAADKEGTDIKSTGESGTTKFLRTDGDGTSSWQAIPTTVPTTITVADESSDTTCNVLFTTAATGDLAPKSGTNLTFNSSSGALTATSFAGTGDFTGVALDGKADQAAETLTAGSTVTVDCSTGNYFKLTAGQNTTIAFSNVPTSGTSYICVLEITAGSYSVTWPAAVKWPASSSGSAPSLTASKVHNFVLATSDGGTNWRAQGNVDYAS